MKRVVFFSPSADLWEHTFPEALVAEMLQQTRSYEAAMVRCAGMLRPLCPAGQAVGFTLDTPEEEQFKLCARCRHKGELLDHKLGLKHLVLDDFVEAQDEYVVAELQARAEALRATLSTPADFAGLQAGGLPVGQFALYDLILRHKKNDLEFSDAAWREYLAFLAMATRVVLAGDRLLARETPHAVSAYNSLYVPHRAFCRTAVHRQLPQYFMHAGTNLARQHGTLMIGQDFTWKYLRTLVDEYPRFADVPASAAVIDDAVLHFVELFEARNLFVYSAARSEGHLDVRAHFGVREDQQFLVASTSSYDERFAVETVGAFPPSDNLLFPKILDWLRFMIEQASHRPDWFLLIRVHPREFPNRRDPVKSAHVQKMQQLLMDLPPNVRVNWPDENISLYDLAQEADVFLNAWSSVGKEMTLLGLPVVIYSPELVLYPASLNYTGTTPASYVAALERALVDGWSAARIQAAFRWYGVEFSRSMVDLRASFAPSTRYRRPFALRALLRLLRIVLPAPQERWDIIARREMPAAREHVRRLFDGLLQTTLDANEQSQFNGDAGNEKQAMRAGLQRLAALLFKANPPDRPSRLQRNFIAAGLSPGKPTDR